MKHTFAIPVAALLAALTAFSLNAWAPAKEAVVHKRPVSKSMWIWAADKPIQNGSIACFRIGFTLDSPAAAAFVKVNYDDSGNLWLNGKALNGGKGLNTEQGSTTSANC